MRTIIATALTLAWAAPLPLGAQSAMELCQKLGENFTVGQWVQYKMTAADIPGGEAELRFAIVGTEQAVGKKHFWFELSMNTSMGLYISQFLVPGYPYEEQEIQAVVMKMGDQPAMKLPAQMLNMMQRQGDQNQAMKMAKQCDQAEELGWERVTVPEGSHRALHLRAPDNGGEVWVTDGVPFGMVKWMGTKGEQMVLVGHGADAKSSITETPQEMPGMGMPPPEFE